MIRIEGVCMSEKEIIEIVNPQGEREDVQLVTYLITEDQLKQYIVYTKGEVVGTEGDFVIYISRLFKDAEGFKIQEISDDVEWNEVQQLLKRIANV